jgi:hypothetical protein
MHIRCVNIVTWNYENMKGKHISICIENEPHRYRLGNYIVQYSALFAGIKSTRAKYLFHHPELRIMYYESYHSANENSAAYPSGTLALMFINHVAQNVAAKSNGKPEISYFLHLQTMI